MISYNINIIYLADMSIINTEIFKAYDIRGVYPEEINEETARKIGLAFAKFTKAKNILIAEDGRTSSPALRKALIEGIRAKGNIVLAGRATTPMFYFAAANTKNIGAGIMVTASHNPAKYNGFKMVWGDAMPIEPKELIPLMTDCESMAKDRGRGKNKIKKIGVRDAYVKKLLSLVDAKKIKPQRIVIDAGNGMAGGILPKILKRLPQIKTIPLFFKVDMTFPNHEANPLKEETLDALKKKVLENKADLGVAYDGDADRVGFVDEKGETVRADFVFAALAPALLAQYPKSKLLYDLRCSKIIPEEIERLGGKSAMTRVGHAFIKKQLREEKAVAAAELSSHFYFKNFFGVECADLVLLYLLSEISRQNKPLSRIVAPFKKYCQSGEINFEVKDKEKMLADLKNKYLPVASNFTHIDGIRFEFKEGCPSTNPRQSLCNWWWFSVRVSNTEPLLRLNLEASNKKLLSAKLDEVREILESNR